MVTPIRCVDLRLLVHLVPDSTYVGLYTPSRPSFFRPYHDGGMGPLSFAANRGIALPSSFLLVFLWSESVALIIPLTRSVALFSRNSGCRSLTR
jgi:hypothetical protein